jgi:hypothetical protein
MRRRSEEKPIKGKDEKNKEKAQGNKKGFTSREKIHRSVSCSDEGTPGE